MIPENSVKPDAIEALFFDFDGLIVDTESPKFEAWNEIYSKHGARLALEDWALCLGTSDRAFDPIDRLQKCSGKTLDRGILLTEFSSHLQRKLDETAPLPGVTALIEHARRNGLALGIASSSPRAWVVDHLRRIGLAAEFDCILCKEDAPRAKPEPDLYLLLARRLGVAPRHAIAFEDSPNGIAAAQAAGIFCVGVPNQLTRHLDLSRADWLLPSLAAFSPPRLLAEIQTRKSCRSGNGVHSQEPDF